MSQSSQATEENNIPSNNCRWPIRRGKTADQARDFPEHNSLRNISHGPVSQAVMWKGFVEFGASTVPWEVTNSLRTSGGLVNSRRETMRDPRRQLCPGRKLVQAGKTFC